ncbi:MAG: TlpA disulfide reductase family protein [Planctomycetota bacterium]
MTASHDARPFRFAIAVSMCLAAGLSTAASARLAAQPASGAPDAAAVSIDAEARAVLDAATQALRSTPGFGAQFRMLGEGSDLIKSTMPSMSGRFVFGTANDQRIIHMLGEAKDTADADSYAFDFVRSQSKITWTDDAAQTVFVRKAKPDPRNMPGAARMILVSDILGGDPFAAAIARSESVVSEGTETVAGVACDTVLLNFRKPSGVSHTAERWYFGQDDGLPRRFEQITDAGMIEFSLILELSQLEPGAQAPTMLDVRRPDNYRVDDQTIERTRTGQAVRPAPGNVTRAAPTKVSETRATPARDAAPAFAFGDDAGVSIDNNSQMGRVSVLYFWGTWCVPCRAVSPEISKLAERFGEQDVDVFGVAVRERDPAAARSYIAQKGYQHRLVLDADAAAAAFRVRVYPTVAVIDREGRIAYTGSPGRDRDAAQLASEVALAVQDALGGG